MKSLAQIFEHYLDIRKQELGRVLLMSSYLLLIIASYSITKAVRDSLFVTKIGPAQLPYVYLSIAAVMGLVSIAYSKAVNSIGLHRLIRTTAIIAVSNLLLFWLVFRSNSGIWFYVLYVWASLFGAITASQFWLLATHVFDPREARRVFSWIGLGGILGGILGGAATNRMAQWFGTESLLLVCAGMMGITIVLLERVTRITAGTASLVHTSKSSAETPAENSTDWTLFRQVRQSRHLTAMVLLLTVAVIVEAFIDYEYKFVAKQSIASKDHLTAFFGSVTFYIGLCSLLLQVFVTNRILKRFGVGWAILFLPAALFAAFLALAMRPALWTAALLQFVDGGLGYSIHRSGMELLYLPIPPQTRNAVKGFIDMFVDRSGRAAGALLLLLFTAGLTLSIPSLSLIASVFVAAWIVIAVAVRREYKQSFRQALERKTIEPEALQFRHLDRATMNSLLALLSGEDERQVLYALDLLSNTPPNRWRDQIDILIHHPSRAVRARTIAVLANWKDPAIARREFIHHPDYETARIATATALRVQWTDLPRDGELLNSLLYDSSAAVAREAILTASVVGYAEALPFLMDKLGDKRLRRDARHALLKFGDAVIPELVRRLADGTHNLAIRRRIPKTLALTGKQQAADALLQHFHRLDYQLDYAVLKALNRMRTDRPDIVVSEDAVRAAIAKERDEYDRLKSVLFSLEGTGTSDAVVSLLIRAIHERLLQRLDRIFRLVALIYSPHDIYSVYYNCQIKPALRPAALEFLDNILDAELKEMVGPLLEEEQTADRTNTVTRRVQFISRAAVLSMLSMGEDPWLTTIAKELLKRIGEQRGEPRDRRSVTH